MKRTRVAHAKDLSNPQIIKFLHSHKLYFKNHIVLERKNETLKRSKVIVDAGGGPYVYSSGGNSVESCSSCYIPYKGGCVTT
jgi:hypothetical protein